MEENSREDLTFSGIRERDSTALHSWGRNHLQREIPLVSSALCLGNPPAPCAQAACLPKMTASSQQIADSVRAIAKWPVSSRHPSP